MTPEEIRSLPFFWSCRRRRYWRQCRRRYFLHYIASRLGRNGCDDPLCRRAFVLDRLVTPQAFVRIILCQAMHDLFYGSGRGTLEQQSVARFRSGVNTMLLHPESAPLVVEGISVTGKNVKAAADGIEEDIRRAACATAENFWDKIDLIPSFYRR
ncbi:MAG: hypothetical protein IJU70_09275, partial [Lentisphaeria bacterium]|nr:hypothetical protein [Lentisphaeria bacterium]